MFSRTIIEPSAYNEKSIFEKLGGTNSKKIRYELGT